MYTREYTPGIGQAVADRTINRIKEDGTRETWGDVAERVAEGNASLLKNDFYEREKNAMHKHLAQASLLMSGRHLQHGDADQPHRPQEVMTNCSTAAASFLLFRLLLSGSGVGTDYSDHMQIIDWAKDMPNMICTIDPSHPDVLSGEIKAMSRRDAEHLYRFTPFVVHEVEDSREGWAEAVQKIEEFSFKRLHGMTILDFSKVRHRGQPIRGMQNRPASGPGPLMEALRKIAAVKNSGMPAWMAAMFIDHYLAECVLVGGARRAARMATKYWQDAGVLDFIELKRGGFLWSSNNSILVDAEFWAEADVEGTWAYQVYNAAVRAAYEDGTGEPGFINVDKLEFDPTGIEAYIDGSFVDIPDMADYLAAKARACLAGPYHVITNPCVTADTWIETTEGPKRVSELIGVAYTAVVNGKPYSAPNGFWKTGEKPVYLVKTARGYSFKATGDHKVLVETKRKRSTNGVYVVEHDWVEVKDLTETDRVVLDQRVVEDPLVEDEFKKGWLVGSVTGDGGHNPEKYSSYLRFWGDYAEALAHKAAEWVKHLLNPSGQFKGPVFNSINKTWSVSSCSLTSLCQELLSDAEKKPYDALEKSSTSFLRGYIAGIFDADGSIQGTVEKGNSVRLSQSDLERLKTVQRILLRLGIVSSIYEGRHSQGYRDLPGGNYFCKEHHELVISNSSLETFRRLIPLQDVMKAAQLDNALSGRKRSLNRDDFTASVESVTLVGVEAVYDCLVEEAHRFSANGVIVHNCGEIVLFLLGGYCVIADVVPYFAEDDNDAEQAFRVAVRALIRTNQMRSLYSRETKRTNRIGVGFTGLFEFALKRFGYGWYDLVDEEKSLDFWLLMKRFSDAVKEEAVLYARELGVVVPHTATTVKPAGTTSKLFNLTEGAHLPAMLWYLRWVQFRNDDPLIAEYRAKGYPVRELKTYNGTTIVGFPTKPAIVELAEELGLVDKLVTAAQATPEEQFQWLRLLEKYWIGEEKGNQVSYTLKYDPKKVSFDEFRATILANQPTVKCCSVMPQISDLAYEYSPEESVTKGYFEYLTAGIEAAMNEDIDLDSLKCASGACPI